MTESANEIVTVQNPFENERAVAPIGAGASAEVQRAVAEVQASIMLAKQFPRNKFEAMDKILAECCRETLAQSAIYSYPKGGQEVTGPSIRLAEVLAQGWNNIHFGWNEVSRANGQSEIIAFSWDLESNVRRTTQFFIKHWRDTKKGGYAIKDERDIYELCANQAARRMRACILNTIPGDVVEAAVAQCEKTLIIKEVVTPEAIKNMIAAFEPFGVTKEHIETRIGRKADVINGAIMVQLRKIYNGLRDGMSKPHEFFEVPASEDKPVVVSSDISSLTGKPALKAAEPPKPSEAIKTSSAGTTRRAEDSDWWLVIDEIKEMALLCKTPQALAKFAEDYSHPISNITMRAPPDIREYWTNTVKAIQKGFSVKAA